MTFVPWPIQACQVSAAMFSWIHSPRAPRIGGSGSWVPGRPVALQMKAPLVLIRSASARSAAESSGGFRPSPSSRDAIACLGITSPLAAAIW